jgi:hypothetical protein
MENNTTEVAEVMPSYYEIDVQYVGGNFQYTNVVAFQIEDRLLQLSDGTASFIIPINENVLSLRIEPIFKSEEETYVTIP